MAWTYNVAQLATSALFRVRLAIGDTNTNDQQLQDEEITQILDEAGSESDAIANAARVLEAKYARYVDKWVGDLKILASQRTRAFRELAEKYEASAGGYRVPSAGGIRISDKETITGDSDLVPPSFTRDLHDNTEE